MPRLVRADSPAARPFSNAPLAQQNYVRIRILLLALRCSRSSHVTASLHSGAPQGCRHRLTWEQSNDKRESCIEIQQFDGLVREILRVILDLKLGLNDFRAADVAAPSLRANG